MARGRRSRGGNGTGGDSAPATAPPAPTAQATRRVVEAVDSDNAMGDDAGRRVVVHSAWSAGEYDDDYEDHYEDDYGHSGWSPASADDEDNGWSADAIDYGHSGWSPANSDDEDAYFDDYADEDAEMEYEDDVPRSYGYQRRAASLTPAEPLTPPPLTLCRFFVLGKCRYGSRCTYSHVLPTAASCGNNEEDDETVRAQVAATMVDCPFFQRGNCKYGDYCRLRHATRSAAAAPSSNQSQHTRQNHSSTGHQTTSSASARDHAAPPSAGSETTNQSEEFTCGICFEDIVEQGKHFGLLSCDHCFCVECLRAWRQSKDMEVEVTRACPACRLPSNYVVPSLKFCTGDEKRVVVDAYKRHLAIRECKYFDGTFGSCPFGPNCFYAHRNSNGDDVKSLDRARRHRRRRSDSDESFTSSYASESTRGSRRGTFATLLERYSDFLLYLEALGQDDGHGFNGGWD